MMVTNGLLCVIFGVPPYGFFVDIDRGLVYNGGHIFVLGVLR